MALPEIPPLHEPDDGSLADLLDWWALFAIEPTVIGTKTGRLQTTWRYVCPDTEHMQPPERGAYLARLHSILLLLDEGWSLDADWWHEAAPAYPEAHWQHPAHWLVDELRRLEFQANPRHTSTSYLTLSWQPPRATTRWVRDVFVTRGAQQAERQALDYAVELFQRGVERFTDLLRPVWLGIEPLDSDATCTYLHHCTSWDRHPLRTPACLTDLDWQLCSSTWLPGAPPLLAGREIQPITITTWQERLSIWLPESLARLPFPCRYHVRWTPMGVQAADKYCYWQQKKWAGSSVTIAGMLKKADQSQAPKARDQRSDAARVSQSLLAVQEEVVTGQEMLGWLTPTVFVWADDPETLQERTRTVNAVLFGHGLVARVEEAGASLAWLASLPGHVRLGTRQWPLRTTELTALIPHGDVWPGVPWNSHLKAPALCVATTDATPFYFCSHVGENGNRMIVGPTRSGKSGLVGLLARQWFRYPGARKAVWDKDYAHKGLTLLSGGVHYDLGTPGCSGFHVLGRIDTEAERVWALGWLEAVLQGEGLPPDPYERRELWQALERLAGMPAPQRTMSLYRRLMQVQRLKIGLEPFCQGGPYGFFDATEDAFGLEARFVCFEMNTVFGQPRAIGPTLSYLFHRLETEWFDGSPVNITMEEARWLLQLEPYLGNLEELLKAKAKLNVSVELVCQEVYDLAKTTAWQAILASVPTRIFLPNPDALNPKVRAFYEELGLDETELTSLMTMQRLREYLYHSPLGRRVFQQPLGTVERLLCAASTPEERAILDMLAAVHTPQELPAAWLAHWGHPDEARLLMELQEGDEHAAMDSTWDRDQPGAGGDNQRTAVPDDTDRYGTGDLVGRRADD